MHFQSKNNSFTQVFHINELKQQYDVFLFDVWGVVYEGTGPYLDVAKTVNDLSRDGKHVIFLSNAPRPREDSIHKISTECGIDIKDGHFFTSGQVTLDLLQDSQKSFNINKPLVYNVGRDRNTTLLAEHQEFETLDINEANILLITAYRDDHENLNDFDEVMKIAAKKQLPAICANPDTRIVNGDAYRLCAGYFAQKYQEFGGVVTFTGKPNTLIYETMAQFLIEQGINVPKERMLMIGDTFDTDILGAQNFGIDSALVLTGNTRELIQGAQNISTQLEVIKKNANKLDIYPTHIITLT